MDIKIRIDEDACVGCQLCVDECPTDVFEFDEAKSIPVVKHEKECFGCFSCSEICPAEAIAHEGAELSNNFYHESYAMDLAEKLVPGMEHAVDVADEAQQTEALQDLGIRLLSIASVFRHTLGGSMPAVGTMAGRTLANQLPRYQEPETFQDVLNLAKKQFAPSWDLNFTESGEELTVETGTCFIRELCNREGIELGGDLCVLFYNNLAGYLGKMGGIRLKLLEMCPGPEKCTYSVKLFRKK
jgi:NAD-dependent dihydropyrimidine dehydrogenase PreA subunit